MILTTTAKYFKFFLILAVSGVLGITDAGLLSFNDNASAVAHTTMPCDFGAGDNGEQAEEPLPKSEEKISGYGSEEYLHNEHAFEELASLSFLEHSTQHASIYSTKYGELISPPPDKK